MKKKLSTLLFILYVISFVPYLYLIRTAFFGFDVGIFIKDLFYDCGFSGVVKAFRMGMPVYLIVLIFQIVYIAIKYKTFSEKRKLFVKWLIGGTIALIVIPVGKEEIILNYNYQQDKFIIEGYLRSEFGVAYAEEMKVLKPDNISLTYEVSTPLLDDGFIVIMNTDRIGVRCDTFYFNFIFEKKLHEKVNYQLKSWLDLPDNIDINVIVKDIDIQNYDVDTASNLLEKCDYKIDYITFYSDHYDQKEIIETIKDIYVKCNDVLKTHYLHNMDFPDFYVDVNDVKYACISVKDTYDSDLLNVYFEGYIHDGQSTIPNENMQIRLSDHSEIK